MQTALRILLFSFAVTLLIGSGLFGGKYLADLKKPPTQEEINLKEARLQAKKQAKLQKQRQKEQARARSKLKEKDEYQAALPDFGPLMHMKEITVEYPEDQPDTAVGYINKETAEKVTNGQDVILYDLEDYVLPLGGKVAAIEEDNDQYKVTISLPEGTNTEYLSKDLEIIVFKTITSKRLPHSAVQTDSNGETYVWVAYAEGSYEVASKIKKLPIDIGISDPDYFEEGTHKIEAYDYIVINPDKTLQSNKTYSFAFVELDAPLHTPTKQAWIDYEIYKYNANQDEAAEKVAKCRGGTVKVSANPTYNPFDYDNPNIGDTTHACTSTPPTTGPLAVFNSLTNNSIGAASVSSSGTMIDVIGGGCGAQAAACDGSSATAATSTTSSTTATSCNSGCSAQ